MSERKRQERIADWHYRYGDDVRTALRNEVSSANADAREMGKVEHALANGQDIALFAKGEIGRQAAQRLRETHGQRAERAEKALDALDEIEEE